MRVLAIGVLAILLMPFGAAVEDEAPRHFSARIGRGVVPDVSGAAALILEFGGERSVKEVLLRGGVPLDEFHSIRTNATHGEFLVLLEQAGNQVLRVEGEASDNGVFLLNRGGSRFATFVPPDEAVVVGFGGLSGTLHVNATGLGEKPLRAELRMGPERAALPVSFTSGAWYHSEAYRSLAANVPFDLAIRDAHGVLVGLLNGTWDLALDAPLLRDTDLYIEGKVVSGLHADFRRAERFKTALVNGSDLAVFVVRDGGGVGPGNRSVGITNPDVHRAPEIDDAANPNAQPPNGTDESGPPSHGRAESASSPPGTRNESISEAGGPIEFHRAPARSPPEPPASTPPAPSATALTVKEVARGLVDSGPLLIGVLFVAALLVAFFGRRIWR